MRATWARHGLCQGSAPGVYLQDTLETSLFARNMLPACYGPADRHPTPPRTGQQLLTTAITHDLSSGHMRERSGSCLQDTLKPSLGANRLFPTARLSCKQVPDPSRIRCLFLPQTLYCRRPPCGRNLVPN